MQYPKMLYKGDQENYQTVIADDEDHEAELLADGWANYGELPEREIGVAGGSVSEINPSAFVPVEHFDALGEENTKLKEELVETLKVKRDTEERFESFRNDVAAMKERIAELQGDATPIGATNENEGRIVELKKLTVPQLKELAASKGIQFKSNASEKTLIELILTHDAAQADSME